ncbi:MAG: hypothetical protein WC830_17130 [Burkholderiales bacterium]|jgi:hypothetical protein
MMFLANVLSQSCAFAFFNNRGFGADTLFICAKTTVGAQSAQWLPSWNDRLKTTHRAAMIGLVLNPDSALGFFNNRVSRTDVLYPSGKRGSRAERAMAALGMRRKLRRRAHFHV